MGGENLGRQIEKKLTDSKEMIKDSVRKLLKGLKVEVLLMLVAERLKSKTPAEKKAVFEKFEQYVFGPSKKSPKTPSEGRRQNKIRSQKNSRRQKVDNHRDNNVKNTASKSIRSTEREQNGSKSQHSENVDPILHKLAQETSPEGRRLYSIHRVKDLKGKTILKCGGETPYIADEVAPHLIGFAAAYHAKTGKALELESTFRTVEHQKRLRKKYEQKKGPYAEEPGMSNHNTGRAIDVKRSSFQNFPGGVDAFESLIKAYHFKPLTAAQKKNIGEDWHINYREKVPKNKRYAVSADLSAALD